MTGLLNLLIILLKSLDCFSCFPNTFCVYHGLGFGNPVGVFRLRAITFWAGFGSVAVRSSRKKTEHVRRSIDIIYYDTHS